MDNIVGKNRPWAFQISSQIENLCTNTKSKKINQPIPHSLVSLQNAQADNLPATQTTPLKQAYTKAATAVTSLLQKHRDARLSTGIAELNQAHTNKDPNFFNIYERLRNMRYAPHPAPTVPPIGGKNNPQSSAHKATMEPPF